MRTKDNQVARAKTASHDGGMMTIHVLFGALLSLHGGVCSQDGGSG